MDRTIKFRAWSGTSMLENVIPVYDEDDNVYRLIQSHPILGVSITSYSVKIMQFTGLYDIEGQEIYEKDIVEIELFGTIELYVVLWRNDFFCWAYLPIEYAKETLDGWGDAFESQLTYQHKPKKLGNIYEHPQLLNNES